MKILFLILALIVTDAFAIAQKESIVTIRQKLTEQSADSEKIVHMLSLGSQYQFIKPDSAIHYFRLALALANKNGFEKQALLCNLRIARFMQDNGNYTEALYLSNQNIEQAEKLKDTLGMWFSVRQILWLYKALGDYDSAMVYADKLLLLTESATVSTSSDPAGYNEMACRYKAEILDSIHQTDSAFYYFASALSFAKKSKDQLSLALSATNIGDFYFTKGRYDSAIYYYKISIPVAVRNLRTDIKMRCQAGIAKIFLKQENLDSALFNANQLMRDARSLPDSATMIDAAFLLSNIFSKKGKIDSAYKYLQYAVTLKDLLSKQEKEKNVRDEMFKESLHKQEVENERNQEEQKYKSNIKIYSLIAGSFVLLLIAIVFYKSSKQKQKDALKIQESFDKLKSTQAQLIQSEKMASLGELTAGIAHEIQNPLNFVNNFSEVNTELIDELTNELNTGNKEEAISIAKDIKENEEKINHHGKRADAIVKGMLQHSRSSTGVKEPTNINALADEYLRLSYHGMRAKDKEFNAVMQTDFDNSIGKINIVPQDIGRVLLNLYNNAFYAVNEKAKTQIDNYEPTVSVTTKKLNGAIELKAKDNGNGIPQKVVDKIFQPFFTTKPTGEGTGLGLSLSYDIIKAHGGEIKVETEEGEGSEFIIVLPSNNV